ncbi:hypothetical protein GCM10007157_28190 [Vreelandella hamiltonii]|uniref:Antitoxin n=1 Tax=Vreelandella hamiltonii TaxID=502829 RepID=A0A8H9LYA5_9GAMM|nr:hypothetical protein GCM10007157_28190 [Halomonas hamiltonii]
MTGITATAARSNLYRLIDETAKSRQSIVIMGKRHKAALVSEEDGAALQETLYLLSVLGVWPPAVSNQMPRHYWRGWRKTVRTGGKVPSEVPTTLE